MLYVLKTTLNTNTTNSNSLTKLSEFLLLLALDVIHHLDPYILNLVQHALYPLHRTVDGGSVHLHVLLRGLRPSLHRLQADAVPRVVVETDQLNLGQHGKLQLADAGDLVAVEHEVRHGLERRNPASQGLDFVALQVEDVELVQA